MANIKKNFNFRNGVQVDDDNLLVTSTGLVGIGTTVPTEALDVRGNVKIFGDATITNATVGVLTITNVAPTQIIGAGVSIKSGIITAQGAGIVTFYGDARYLLGMPTSQWVDTNAGFAVSSIYNQGSTVGIATTNPKSTLQIGDNPDLIGGVSGRGVGLSSVGNINASGIITATEFIGNLTGNIVGIITGNLIGDVNSSGVSTFTDLLVNRNLKVSGISTLGVTTVTNLTSEQVNVSGMSTMDGGITVENLTIGHLMGSTVGIAASINTNNPGTHLYLNAGGSAPNATTFIKLLQNTTISKDLTVTGAITGNQVSGTTLMSTDQLSARQATFGGGGGFLSAQNGISAKNLRLSYGVAGITDSQITSVSTPLVLGPSPGGQNTNIKGPVLIDGSNAQLVIAGSLYFYDPGQTIGLGIGTLSAANDIQVRKSGNAEIQVTSDTGAAGITVGRESGTGNTNNAEFRFGLVSGGAPYSSAQSLDIINYGTGNFNYHLSGNNPGGVAGDFHWHKGFNSARLMTLTNTGRLGIGVTNPTETLTVSGVSTVTSNSFVGGNFNVSGNSVIAGNLTLGGSLGVSALSADITGNVTGNLTGNVNSQTGISTFFAVGINTTIPLSADLDVTNGDAVFKNVGIGSTDPDGILDVSGTLSQASKKFILLPKVSAGSTSVIQSDSVEGGALIYNTTLRKLQFYNGTNWETVTSVEVTG